MKALAWLLAHAATAEWWSLVNDNALRVTDELIVGAVLTDRPGGLAWNEGWPAEGKALCQKTAQASTASTHATHPLETCADLVRQLLFVRVLVL